MVYLPLHDDKYLDLDLGGRGKTLLSARHSLTAFSESRSNGPLKLAIGVWIVVDTHTHIVSWS